MGEASELWEQFEEGATEVEEWTDRAHRAVRSQIDWDSLDKAEQQVDQHKVSKGLFCLSHAFL